MKMREAAITDKSSTHVRTIDQSFGVQTDSIAAIMTSSHNQSSCTLECLCHFWFSCLVVQVLWHVLDPTGLRRGPLATTGRLDPCRGGRGMTTASSKAATWWRLRSAMVSILGDVKNNSERPVDALAVKKGESLSD